VPQPIHPDQDASPEPDPLLAFLAEPGEASGSGTGDAAASPENPGELEQSAPPAEPVESHHQVSEELRLRVDRAERLADQSLLEIATLKSDLATLVGAVEDIKKLQSRRNVPPAPPAQPTKRMSLWGAALAVVVLLSFTTLGWGLATVVSKEEVPEAPPIESESAPPAAAAPVVDATPPAAEIQTPATVAATPTARARPRDDPPPRSASRTPTGYVGTLSIDANPAGEVFVNRQSAGRTPLRLDKLRAGSHLIWIEREGYRRWTRVVAVAANRVSRVSATLDPIPR
jgi:hypothetical protein